MERCAEIIKENQNNLLDEKLATLVLRDEKNGENSVLVKPPKEGNYFITVATVIMDYQNKTFTVAREIIPKAHFKTYSI